MTLIISITAVSAAENSTTSPVVNTHVESNTQNQLTTVAEKEVVSNNKVETNAISKATKSVKTSEVKSTNNDKISNESGSKILTSTKTDDKVTQTTTKSNNNTIQTSSQTIIQNKSVTKTLKTTNDVKSSIVLKINPITTTAQKKITLNATAYTSNNKPLNNVDAVFKINGVTIGKTKTVKGLASLDYTVPKWGAKNYNLLVKVGETSSTLPQSANTTLKLVKDNVTINMGSYSAAPSSKVVFKANITQSNNIPLNNVTVVFKVNDVTIGKTTVLNGMCNMTYTTPKNPKTYKLTVKVGETNYTLSKTFNTNLNVLKPSKITISSNIIASKKSTVTLTAKVTDLTGNLASNGKVAFKINGKTISTISLVKGMASVKYDTSKLSATVNNVTVVYSGNSQFNATSANTKLRVYSQTFSYNEILKKAYDVNLSIEKYHKIPEYVLFGNTKVSSNDFLYMVSKVLSSNNTFYALNYEDKTTSSTSKYGVNIYKNDYIALSKTLVSSYDTTGYSPVSIKAADYSLSYEDAYYLLTRAVSYLYVNKNLPNYSTVRNIPHATSSNITNTTPTLNPSKITISNVIVAEKKSTVTLTAKVTDLTGNLASSGKVAFKINGKTISTISVVNGIATLKYNTTPLSTALNNITVVYSGNSKLNANTTTSKLRLYNYVFSYNEVLKKAYDVKVYIEKYNALPKTVMFGSVGVSQVDFLYMVSRVLSTNNSFYAMGYMAKTSSSTSKYGVNIYKNDYASLSKEIAYNFDTYGYSPVNIKVAGYSLSYEDAYYLLTRAVSYLYVNKNLPNYSTVLNIKTANQTSNPSTSNPSTNTVPDGYSQYLVSSKNCEVNSTAIKNALSKAIAGVTGTYNQAVVIFNYVNKHTSYSGYYNTRYGAIGTLNRGYGNCVDTAHLVIAMMRTANIPARYCHATCYFRSGLVTGHVWAEVYVNGKWYKCDGTSNSNTFGNIVNWNSCGSITRYISLPF